MSPDSPTSIKKDPVQKQLENDITRLKSTLTQLPEPQTNTPFIVVSGLPGSGKTYFCKRLSEKLNVLIISSDTMRKVLFPSPSYTPDESSRLFQAMHHLISELLQKNIPVVFDATNLEEKNREYLYHIARLTGARFILIWIKATPDIIRKRLENREKGIVSENKSDADWEIYLKMSKNIDRIKRQHFVVDTSEDIAPAIEKIVREVSRHK